MTNPLSPPLTETLASFFKRLEVIETIVRIVISEERVRALFTFRGNPEKKVLFDFSSSPARVVLDDRTRDVDIFVTIKGEVMHDILSGRMPAGKALGQRELLLRGSASHLATLIPLFDFAPILYHEHLEKLRFRGSSPRSGQKASEEEVMETQTFEGNPIPLVHLSTFERVVFGMLNGVAYALGYIVGCLRYRLFQKLDLFDVLSAMSRGLAAAQPRETPATRRD